MICSNIHVKHEISLCYHYYIRIKENYYNLIYLI